MHVIFVHKYCGCLLQTPVAVTTSDDSCVNTDEPKQSPKNAVEVDDSSSMPADVCNSSISTVDDVGKPAELGKDAAGDFIVAPSVSSGHAVPNGFSVIKSGSEVEPGAAAGHTECRISQTGSADQRYCMSSFPTYVQSSCSPAMSPDASLLTFPTSTLHLSSRLPFADGQPSAVNWDVKSPSVSALDSLRASRHTVAELFPDRNVSRLPAVGHFSRSENSRHRSVKAGSTWFPTELQMSLACGSAKRKAVETSNSARPCGSDVLSSPLKQFVDRHRTRTVPAQNLSHSSEGVGFHRNDVSTTHHAVVEPAAADQPIDLSTQRRKVEPKLEHISPPYRTHVNTTTSDEPLDLSQSSSSMRPDTRTSGHPSRSGRPWDSGSKVPSGMIDLQNYCNLLLSGGYSLDSPLSTIPPLSSFSSLVSKVYFTHILSTAKLLT